MGFVRDWTGAGAADPWSLHQNHQLPWAIIYWYQLSAIVWENRAEATDRGQPIPFIFRMFSTFIETGWMAVFLNFTSF